MNETIVKHLARTEAMMETLIETQAQFYALISGKTDAFSIDTSYNVVNAKTSAILSRMVTELNNQ